MGLLSSLIASRNPINFLKEAVTAFAFSDNSEIFASGSDNKTIKVWSLERQEIIHSFELAHTGIDIYFLLSQP